MTSPRRPAESARAILATLDLLEPAALRQRDSRRGAPSDPGHVDALAAALEEAATLIASGEGDREPQPDPWRIQWRESCVAFYQTLCATANNPVLTATIVDLRRRWAQAVADRPVPPTEAARTWLFHTRIADALYHGDNHSAAEHMHTLLQWQQRYLRTDGPVSRP